MTYEDILNQAVAMLQRQRLLTYQTLQLQFHLDDNHLEVLKDQLLYAHPQTVSDDGRGLAWTGDSPDPAQNARHETDSESLSRSNHRLPWGQAHPEVVQSTAGFHHQIANARLPQAQPVFARQELTCQLSV